MKEIADSPLSSVGQLSESLSSSASASVVTKSVESSIAECRISCSWLENHFALSPICVGSVMSEEKQRDLQYLAAMRGVGNLQLFQIKVHFNTIFIIFLKWILKFCTP